jgi:hypothetical protein
MAGERRTKQGKDAGRPNSSAIWPTEDAAMRRSAAARHVPHPTEPRLKKRLQPAVAAPGFDPLKKRVGASSGSRRTKRDRPPRRLCWVKRWDGSRTGSSLG